MTDSHEPRTDLPPLPARRLRNDELDAIRLGWARGRVSESADDRRRWMHQVIPLLIGHAVAIEREEAAAPSKDDTLRAALLAEVAQALRDHFGDSMEQAFPAPDVFDILAALAQGDA